ncbi:MAG: galactokinase [Clostridia bacterium]|nr:galactokinase [Clostridia bacterium]
MKAFELINFILDGNLTSTLESLYGEERVEEQTRRYLAAVECFASLYGEEREVSLFSVPGRSELSGNHTDHNFGCVIASSVDLDMIAVASPRQDSVIRLKSQGFSEDIVEISASLVPSKECYGTSGALIAGVCAGFLSRGYRIGGFDAYTTSDVPKGSGLSSSAVFENMIGTVLNSFYNADSVSLVEIAKISQSAERDFFGKPCGLMDQLACALGGVVAIDFRDPTEPAIEQMDLDLDKKGYRLCIVNTGGNHADLTDDYASVPTEMKAVAEYFGKSVLRELSEADVLASISELRARVGDRSVLRALHFFAENARVERQKELLLSRDFDGFLKEVIASGRSSFCYLQNVYAAKNPSEQGISLALCLAEATLASLGGAWRVHGGGFAGTIQAYVPVERVETFCNRMNEAFGEEACTVLRIRSERAMKIL